MAKRDYFRRRISEGLQKREGELLSHAERELGRKNRVRKIGDGRRENNRGGGIRTWRQGEVGENGASRVMTATENVMPVEKNLPLQEGRANGKKSDVPQSEVSQFTKSDQRGEMRRGQAGTGRFNVEALASLPKYEPKRRPKDEGYGISEQRFHKRLRTQSSRETNRKALTRSERESERAQKENQESDNDGRFERNGIKDWELSSWDLSSSEPPAGFGGKRL